MENPEREVTRSFSGAHPFRPQCVIDAVVTEWAEEGLDVTEYATDIAATITVKIDGGICPRCDGDLNPKVTAGSRVTRCRCVPICPACGDDEGDQGLLGTGLSQAWRWPLRKGDITRRRNKVEKYSTLVTGFISGDDGDTTMLTEDGVKELRSRPNPGGWAEFGYDDTEDQTERET